MITGASHKFLRLYRHYDKGILAHAGGICDQPNLYLESMEVLDKTFNQIESDKLKRDRPHGQN